MPHYYQSVKTCRPLGLSALATFCPLADNACTM